MKHSLPDFLQDLFENVTPDQAGASVPDAASSTSATVQYAPLQAMAETDSLDGDAQRDASELVTPETLIATYTSGIQKIKIKENKVEFTDNGEKFTFDPASDDIPTNLEDPYNIDLMFYGEGWSTELLDAFVAASEFLSDMILTGLAEDVAPGERTISGEDIVVDDLLIQVSLDAGDGLGGIVGGATVEAVRSSDGVTADGLPVLSSISFDVADANALLEAGIWDDVVLHEMMHAMGFGTPLWSQDTLTREGAFGPIDLGLPFPVVIGNAIYENKDAEGNDTTLVAAVAEAEGTDPTPLLSGLAFSPFIGGQVLDDFVFPLSLDPLDSFGHWSEADYGNALMTPDLSLEGNVLLDISLASLGDMGYELALDLVAEDNPLSQGIELQAENNVKFTDFAEDVLMF